MSLFQLNHIFVEEVFQSNELLLIYDIGRETGGMSGLESVAAFAVGRIGLVLVKV